MRIAEPFTKESFEDDSSDRAVILIPDNSGWLEMKASITLASAFIALILGALCFMIKRGKGDRWFRVNYLLYKKTVVMAVGSGLPGLVVVAVIVKSPW